MNTIKIINDNAKNILDYIPEESVDLVITSPPYWNLKDYNNKDQLGFGMSYQEYINELTKIFEKVKRVLKKNRMMIINVGDVDDKFVTKDNKKRNYIQSIQSDLIHHLKNLDLLLFRHIIWHKPDYTKNKPLGAIHSDKSFPRYMLATFDIEHILVFFKPDLDVLESNKGKMKELYEMQFTGINNTIAKVFLSNLWEIDKVKNNKVHSATFPEHIPFRLVRLYSFENEVVLDPFMGIGTTLKVATALNRNAIGFDINNHYINHFLNDYLSKQLTLSIYDSFLKYKSTLQINGIKYSGLSTYLTINNNHIIEADLI